MLPIADQRGRIIAFGGRILTADKTDAPKYLNSPDTPLFDKGRTLYNLHRAAPAARSASRIVVVEGYMDVVALAAAGLAEAVAPLGTALTEHQLERLWRVTECPTLCFDGDSAGKRAAMKAVARALPLLRPGHSLRIVTLPDGMDPDDVVKKRGREAMLGLLGEARSLVDVLWEGERDAAPSPRPRTRQASRRGCSTIAKRSSTPTSRPSIAANCSIALANWPLPGASARHLRPGAQPVRHRAPEPDGGWTPRPRRWPRNRHAPDAKGRLGRCAAGRRAGGPCHPSPGACPAQRDTRAHPSGPPGHGRPARHPPRIFRIGRTA
jgi:DNA primase